MVCLCVNCPNGNLFSGISMAGYPLSLMDCITNHKPESRSIAKSRRMSASADIRRIISKTSWNSSLSRNRGHMISNHSVNTAPVHGLGITRYSIICRYGGDHFGVAYMSGENIETANIFLNMMGYVFKTHRRKTTFVI